MGATATSSSPVSTLTPVTIGRDDYRSDADRKRGTCGASISLVLLSNYFNHVGKTLRAQAAFRPSMAFAVK